METNLTVTPSCIPANPSKDDVTISMPEPQEEKKLVGKEGGQAGGGCNQAVNKAKEAELTLDSPGYLNKFNEGLRSTLALTKKRHIEPLH
ncbi:hypothetical protein F0562_015504 [Nyssa sinensis]|uniref:Uncharacterized protein n=1 Tax=Nyssa sinensis TaxID=561372 RepID=A0A5J4ZHH5_9ASTE|nr:hypothetical protein F0562_015504 [Nyssa sinensis]